MNIEDERAIARVLIRYATAIDQRDWMLFGTCFTDNVVADYGAIGRWNSRAALASHMEAGHLKIGPSLHRITNIVITGEGNHAAATSYVDALLMPLQPGGRLRRAEGLYHDRLVREGQEWKISNRRFEMVRIEDKVE